MPPHLWRHLGNPMQLTMVGAFGGEGIVTVHRIGQETTIDGRDFENLVLLNCSQRPVHDGDSGSGCFAKMTEGEYRLSCIVFASMSGATSEHANYGWAFPAKTAEDKLSIVFGNRKPIADAGPTQAVTGGTLVTLDAGLSYDEDGDEVSYVWEQAPGVGGQGAGPLVQTPSPGRVTFTAPTGPAALTFKLTVTDQHGGVGTDETHVHVSVAPPRANAGPDQAIDTRYPVPLLAFFSRNCTYKWEQLPGGTRVELNNADKRYAWFTAPGGATTLRFRVTVTDRQGASDGDDMTVVVRNRPPGLVTAGDQIVSQGGPVALSGGGSDPDVDDIVTFKWEQLTGPPVELADADTPYATFTAPSRVANLGFQFTVADNHGASVSAIEVVRVR